MTKPLHKETEKAYIKRRSIEIEKIRQSYIHNGKEIKTEEDYERARTEWLSAHGDLEAESGHLENYLAYLEIRSLLKSAREWNVEIDKSWVEFEGEIFLLGLWKRYTTLTSEGERALRGALSKTKEAFYVKWVNMLMPLASLAVAALSLIVSIIALFKIK
jgi:hypothetical protein